MGHTAVERTIFERPDAAVGDFSGLLSREQLLAKLHAIGAERYHHRHPFHLRMHEGKLTREQIQAWVLNRYYYQQMIPIKDAIILSRGDAEFRRAWRKRIVDHDGTEPGSGGIECWLLLAETCGLNRKMVESCEHVLPAARFAVDSYIPLVSDGPFLQAVASSLTELFSGKLIALRMECLNQHYPWLSQGLAYFKARLTQSREDAEFAFAYVFEHASTREEQELIAKALTRKCDMLWAQLDALYYAYVEPGFLPPGGYRFEEKDDAR
jgi:coenzyme PQQ biosynthesis protein C